MLAETEELLDILGVEAMRAETLAVSSPEYEALADAVGYALVSWTSTTPPRRISSPLWNT